MEVVVVVGVVGVAGGGVSVSLLVRTPFLVMRNAFFSYLGLFLLVT